MTVSYFEENLFQIYQIYRQANPQSNLGVHSAIGQRETEIII